MSRLPPPSSTSTRLFNSEDPSAATVDGYKRAPTREDAGGISLLSKGEGDREEEEDEDEEDEGVLDWGDGAERKGGPAGGVVRGGAQRGFLPPPLESIADRAEYESTLAALKVSFVVFSFYLSGERAGYPEPFLRYNFRQAIFCVLRPFSCGINPGRWAQLTTKAVDWRRQKIGHGISTRAHTLFCSPACAHVSAFFLPIFIYLSTKYITYLRTCAAFCVRLIFFACVPYVCVRLCLCVSVPGSVSAPASLFCVRCLLSLMKHSARRGSCVVGAPPCVWPV